MSPEDSPTEISDGNMEAVATVKKNAEYACAKLGEDDVFTEDNSGDMISQQHNLNLSPVVTDTSIGKDCPDDEDIDDAIKALSNMKRYKMNPMCHQNTVVIGWEKLGLD